MDGYFGKFLEVNLSKEQIADYEIPENWYRKYLGGRGLTARILLEEMPSGVDPLGSENVLVYGTGPLQGTEAQGAGRNIIMAKSPKTSTVTGSYVGGFFPYELGTSGYDGIIFKGKADSPKYLAIVEGESELRDAEDLWGMEVADVEETLKDRHDGGRVSSIGIAGENLVNLACIINDRNRAAGRPGFGAVMGSKKLKAVLVKGGIYKPLSDPEKFDQARNEMIEKLSPVIEWGKYGTSSGVGGLNEMGILPTKNFQDGVFDDYENIVGSTMYEEILEERDTCANCPVACKRVVNTKVLGEEVKNKYGGPEYETLASLGSLCMNNDLDVISLANQKCNAYGIDTIGAGVAVAFLMEASEIGLIDKDIKWGNGQDIIEIIEKIANREGIGEKLANGINKFAENIGAKFDMQVKGQEIPMHEPRGKTALAISYAASPRGANHMETMHDTFTEHPHEMKKYFEQPPDRFDLDAKPKFCYHYENLVSFTNSVIYCAFHGWVGYFQDSTWIYPEIRTLIEGATGIKLNVNDMLKIGERNFNLLKILATREGIKRKSDKLPKRFSDSLLRGPSQKNSIPKNQLNKAIDKYYKIRGWGDKGPTEKRLKKLDIGETTKYINQ